MKKHTLHKGFTLIELLVVVAIIALLSATILASLASARNKAKDAKIQSELQSVQAQMELYYNDNNFSYGTAQGPNGCNVSGSAFTAASTSGTDGALNLITGIANDTTGSTSNFTKMECGSDGASWATAAELSTTHWWCVDSNGESKDEGTTAPAITSPYGC